MSRNRFLTTENVIVNNANTVSIVRDTALLMQMLILDE